MPSPFPGMDPYLEHPRLWPGVHHRLITAISDSLSPQLRPKYIVAIEERIYAADGEDSILIGIPDLAVQRPQKATTQKPVNVAVVAPPSKPVTVTVPMPETVREGYLEIRDVVTSEVITAIEILSPTNKRLGKGRQAYESKRQEILSSFTHLVEIDLLRSWEPMPFFNHGIQGSYRILVSRENCRPEADLYIFNLPDVIPSFPLPLRSEDREPVVDLQVLLSELYDRAAYDLIIDYTREPVPPLSDKEAVWADVLLRERELR